MKITDKAVEAFIATYKLECDHRYDPDAIRAALTAALPHMGGVSVKPLEWHGDNGHGAGFKYVIAEPSRTPGWRVWVNLTDIGANGMATSIGGRIVTMKAESRDAAKAAAQADYERRIMSAIEVSASPRVVTDEVDGGWLIHKAGRGWYRPNAQGYTNDTAQAGRYSHEDALSYSHPNGWDGPRDGITIKHESELQSLRTAALPSAGEKEGNYTFDGKEFPPSPHPTSTDKPEVVAFLVDCPAQPTLEFANVHVPDSAEPLVTLSDYEALRAENERRRKDYDAACEEAAKLYSDKCSAEARIAELENALEFYADVSKYPSPLTGGMGALWQDCGQRARNALKGQNNG